MSVNVKWQIHTQWPTHLTYLVSTYLPTYTSTQLLSHWSIYPLSLSPTHPLPPSTCIYIYIYIYPYLYVCKCNMEILSSHWIQRNRSTARQTEQDSILEGRCRRFPPWYRLHLADRHHWPLSHESTAPQAIDAGPAWHCACAICRKFVRKSQKDKNYFQRIFSQSCSRGL